MGVRLGSLADPHFQTLSIYIGHIAVFIGASITSSKV